MSLLSRLAGLLKIHIIDLLIWRARWRFRVKTNDCERTRCLGNHHAALLTFDHDRCFSEDEIPSRAQHLSATNEIWTRSWTQE